jgi:hypothetical protein
MKKLIPLVAMAWLAVQVCVQAQVTNFNNFKPLRMTVTRVDDPSVEQGVYIRFATDIGRVYRVERSATLTNWTLLQQIVADDTNVSLWFPITNMTAHGSGTNGGGGGPLPMPGGSALLASAGGTTQVGGPPPLPYPWEPYYQPAAQQSLTAASLAAESADSFNDGDGSPGSTTVHQFYRVVCPEDRIQFPEWQNFVEHYMRFDMWSSLTGGTYRLELFADTNRVFASTNIVPINGRFGVHDSSYNPNNWPYSGYYPARQWTLNVNITPHASMAGQSNAAVVVQKEGRRRNPNRSGITVSQFGSLGENVGSASQADFDLWMENYYLSCYQGAYQVDLNGSPLEPLPQSGAIPVIRGTNDWARLRRLIMDTNNYPRLLTDMHYFGHGNPQGLGGAGAAGVPLSLLSASRSLYLDPMAYVGLDGCRIAETYDVLKALLGTATTSNRRTVYQSWGWIVRFGWGWNNEKRVSYLLQGTLADAHFEWVGDFYYHLTERPIPGGFMLNNFETAIQFANAPQGQSPFNPLRQTNNEGKGLKYMGCVDCYFDE